MQEKNRSLYVAIDLKSFYASVECIERGLNPMTTNLVVADESRTEKTVCLAVTPSLKQYGIAGRARLFEVIRIVKEVNAKRKERVLENRFMGKSYDDIELKKHPEYELDYIIACPRMKYYMQYSTNIYNIYLKYFSEEDIYVYSIDEVFIDVTHYLETYDVNVFELLTEVLQAVYETTGITATAGIGTNLYLCKIAMDIVAKHIQPNKNGVRIAYLDEMLYRKQLWNHRPLTDFWRLGKGYSKKLEQNGLMTMGDIARCSINNEDKLYNLFGINAELLIDHAWGFENCTISDVKSHIPINKSLSSGQVLHEPYPYEKTKVIIKEMAEVIALDLVEKGFTTNQLVLNIDYDTSNLLKKSYSGEISTDKHGRKVPQHAHGTINLAYSTSSSKIIVKAFVELFDKVINKDLLTRKVTITTNNIVRCENKSQVEQINLFENTKEEKEKEIKENNLQKSILDIKRKYGKNVILKGINFEKGATTKERNEQVGGHKG